MTHNASIQTEQGTQSTSASVDDDAPGPSALMPMEEVVDEAEALKQQITANLKVYIAI